MKKALVTGARAPAALEMIRSLSKSFLVYAADTLNHPVSRASKFTERFFITPAPNKDPQSYINSLIEIIKKESIDLLVPSCEEIFFIAKFKNQFPKSCTILCDEFKKLKEIHHKFNFLELTKNCYINTPETKLIRGLNEFEENKVYKPCYTRFANQVLIKPSLDKLRQELKNNENSEFLKQNFIAGEEFCSYAIAMKGKLIFNYTYKPKYKIGIGASFYFEQTMDTKINNFVKAFVEKNNYTGQIGFDFIKDNHQDTYVIEANPRATSGVHFIEKDLDWLDLFKQDPKSVEPSNKKQNKMLVFAMLSFGLKYLLSKDCFKFIKSLFSAQDVLWSKRDFKPFFYQFISLFEIISISLKERSSITTASTQDLEWNGEKLLKK